MSRSQESEDIRATHSCPVSTQIEILPSGVSERTVHSFENVTEAQRRSASFLLLNLLRETRSARVPGVAPTSRESHAASVADSLRQSAYPTGSASSHPRHQSPVRRPGIIPFADHPIRLSLLCHEMQDGLEEIVVEPPLLIEPVEGVALCRCVEAVIADRGSDERIVLLLDEAIIILLVGPTAAASQPGAPRQRR